MKKHLTIILGGFFFCMGLLAGSPVHAQTRFSRHTDLSFGASGLLPLGGFGRDFNFGWGLDAQLIYHFNHTLGVSLLSGYNNFGIDRSTGQAKDPLPGFSVQDYNYIPVRAGLRIQVGKFYVEPQGGIAFATNHFSSNAPDLVGQIGWLPARHWDVGLRFENLLFNNNKNSYEAFGSDAGILGLRIAYHIGNH